MDDCYLGYITNLGKNTHTHTHSLSLSQALCFRNLLESGGIWTIRVWGVPLNLGLGA